MPSQAPTTEDWKKAAQMLSDAVAGDSMAAIVDAIIRQAHELFSAEIVICDRFDEQARQVAFQMHPAPTPEFVQLTLAPFVSFWHQHPFQADWVKTFGGGHVGFLSDRISGREFRRTALWNEAYIHLRGKNQILVGGQIEPDRFWCLSLNRLGSDFGPRDRELCRYLQPHINRLLQRQARRDRASRALTALDQAGAAYLVVDSNGQLLEASGKAHALLTKSGPAAKGRIALLSTRQTRTGMCIENFGNLQAMLFRPAHHAPAFVMLGETVAPMVADANKPTPREADILHWLGEGKSNPEIALVLGVSPRTVEKHCERLFAKLGVENRLAAALLARR